MASGLKITVIEDHDALRAVTVEVLRQKGHRVQGISCAEALGDEAASLLTDLFIIDLNLPGEDGLSLSKRIRQANPRAGIIMATGRGQLSDRIAGYENGADVYLSKPVAIEELLAAVESVKRRVDLWQGAHGPIQEQGYTANARALTLSGPEGSTVISGSELKMLSSFSNSQGQQLEYWQLMELLGQSPEAFRKATLEVKIVRLRKKLIQVGAPSGCLRSLRLFGYQLCVPIQVI